MVAWDRHREGLLRTATAPVRSAGGERARAMTDDRLRAERGMNDESPLGADPYTAYDDFNLPAYVGLPTFQRLPWVTDAEALADERPDVAIVGAPFDDAVSHRPGASSGRAPSARRATTPARSTRSSWGSTRTSGSASSTPACSVTPMNIERGHAVIERKVLEVARTGAIPIVLGGDHSITYPSASAVSRHCARKLGIVHFDAHADAANSTWGNLRSLARRCAGSSSPAPWPGRTSCRSGCAATGRGRTRWTGCGSRGCAGTS